MNTYEDIRGNFDTGDILLYSGNGPISTTIKAFTRSFWSHVGMVVRTDSDILLVYQSTTLTKVQDYIDGVGKRGVQVNLLSESVSGYNGKVAVRHLLGERTKSMFDNLASFRAEMKNKPYEESERELIRSAYDGPGGHNTEDLSSLFCSELVAEAYQRMGLLSESKSSNEYVPADFNSELDLTIGYSLSDSVLIN